MKQAKRSFALSLVSLLLCFSMLLGTTWAWFTDSVTSANNRISTGTLKIGLEYYRDGNWEKVTETTNVFEQGALWEPGHTEVVYFKISNLGSLALKYDFGINVVSETIGTNVAGDKFLLSDYIRYGVDADKQPEYSGREEAVNAVTANSTPLKAGYSKKSSMNSGDPEVYVALVVYMPETVGNVANAKAGTETPAINLGITLKATQYTVEDDSFGADYDAGAFFPDTDVDVSVTAPVEKDANNKVVSEVTLGSEDNVSAVVSADTLLEAGTDYLTLTVKELETTSGNITVSDGEEARSVDVHVDGIADGNTVPVVVTVRELMPVGLNMGNYTLYHVENGTPVAMTCVTTTPANHNEFSYDPATGDVAVALCSFSEVAVVAETAAAWEGGDDYTWYDPEATEYTIANGDQLSAFGKLVGGMAEGYELDEFKNKTVKLVADINLGDDEAHNVEDKIFYPIGYYNSIGSYEKTAGVTVTSSVNSFEGTFDGNGHTIANFYHNTWEMFGDYNDGYKETPNHYDDAMGLFGYVYNGTVKNLTVDNFSSDGEFTPTGVIAACACNATFENIAITNCNPRVYNTGNGGIVGIGGNSDDPENYKLTFNNITIDNTNKITALWGSWDVACGGLVGMFRGAGHVYMNKCHVAAQIDAYNDVCGNYQYYWYRYSGMLIGTNKNMTEDANGYTVPETDKYHAEDCTVHFDKWNDYYYCELVANSLASYTHDHQFSRLELVKSVDSANLKYVTLDGTEKQVPESGRLNLITLDGDGYETENATCYHFADGEVWNHEQAGYDEGIDENGDGENDLKEDKQHVYLPFNQLFTGYGWGVKHIPVGEFDGVTILDREVADSETKFVAKYEDNTYRIGYGVPVSIGELFEAVDGMNINTSGVFVSAEAVNANNPVVGNFAANSSDWTKSTVTINGTGAVKLTIQDYDYCKPTTLYIEVEDVVVGTDGVSNTVVGLSATQTYKYGTVTVLGIDWADEQISGVTEFTLPAAGLYAIGRGDSANYDYILVGQTDMDGSMYLNNESKKQVNVEKKYTGWYIDSWSSDMSAYNATLACSLDSSTGTYALLQKNGTTIPDNKADMQELAHEKFNIKYANPADKIIPIERLNTIKIKFSATKVDILSQVYENKSVNDYIGTIRIYVADSDVPDGYYEVPFNWVMGTQIFNTKELTVNFRTALGETDYVNPHGYVTGISILPLGGCPDDWEVQDAYKDPDNNGDSDTDVKWAANRLCEYFQMYLYDITTSATEDAPILTLTGDAYDGKYEITGFDSTLSYAVSTDLINYKSIGTGFTSYEVSDTGTYYFRVEGSASNPAATVVINGSRDTVTGLAVDVENRVATGFDANTVYEWAKYTHAGYGEWTTLEAGTNELALTEGLTAVRLPADGSHSAGKPQFLYVEGENAGTIGFNHNIWTYHPVQGIWTPGFEGANLSQPITSLNGILYSIGSYKIYSANTSSFEDIYYTYALNDDEIFSAQQVDTITMRLNPTSVQFENGSVKGKFRFHIAGGLKDYYDVDFATPVAANTNVKINLELPEDEEGYLIGITYWPVYEVTSSVTPTSTYSYVARFYGVHEVDGWVTSGDTDKDNKDVTRCRLNIKK